MILKLFYLILFSLKLFLINTILEVFLTKSTLSRDDYLLLPFF